MGNEKKKKLTEEQQNNQIKKVLKEIEKQRKNVKKGYHFTAPTEEQLRKKFERINSPFIYFQSWMVSSPPGGTINYLLGVMNPDPVPANLIFAHVFVGSGHVVSDTGEFLLNVDTRFPRLTEPNFFGLNLAPGALGTLTFNIKIPTTIDHPANYLVNTALFQINWHDIGKYLDRSVLVFTVL